MPFYKPGRGRNKHKRYWAKKKSRQVDKEIKRKNGYLSTKIIIYEICSIIDGFEIIEYEADGHDNYGQIHWAFCKNGQSSRSYMIKSMCDDSINFYLKEILEDGLEYKGTIYYFDDNLINGNLCSPEFEWKFLTKKQFKEKKQKKQLMKNYVEQYLEKKNKEFEKSDYNYKLNKIKDFLFIDSEKFKKDTQKLFINGWDRIIKDIGDLIPESKGILV
tara:strand:+ start:228 stop:878 length:651 start_codon:yes stop_codon:yes gene_type:complete